jgi:flagellar P-ring protein precursor FlgI
MVTATVPATGARRGDKIDCFVSGINGKSLAGGRLAFAALQGPNTMDQRVYALCQGQVTIDDETQPMVGVVHGGCQMEADVFTPFVRVGRPGPDWPDGSYITFVLDKNHANFQTAAEVAEIILERVVNEEYGDSETVQSAFEAAEPIATDYLVRAIDATNIIVRIPNSFENDPVSFTSELLDTRVVEPEPEPRVVINPRAGTIVISGEVEIGDVIISHKNIVIEAAAEPTGDSFARIDVDESNKAKLDVLVGQLNSLKVPTTDVIEIIRGIERNGKLHGRLIVE